MLDVYDGVVHHHQQYLNRWRLVGSSSFRMFEHQHSPTSINKYWARSLLCLDGIVVVVRMQYPVSLKIKVLDLVRIVSRSKSSTLNSFAIRPEVPAESMLNGHHKVFMFNSCQGACVL